MRANSLKFVHNYKEKFLCIENGFLEQHKGFEPSPTAWKAVMLPLHQCCMERLIIG